MVCAYYSHYLIIVFIVNLTIFMVGHVPVSSRACSAHRPYARSMAPPKMLGQKVLLFLWFLGFFDQTNALVSKCELLSKVTKRGVRHMVCMTVCFVINCLLVAGLLLWQHWWGFVGKSTQCNPLWIIKALTGRTQPRRRMLTLTTRATAFPPRLGWASGEDTIVLGVAGRM